MPAFNVTPAAIQQARTSDNQYINFSVNTTEDYTLSFLKFPISSAFSFPSSASRNGLAVSPDGLQVFCAVETVIYQYQLSTPWDISTLNFASPVGMQDFAATGQWVSDLEFSPNGSHLLLIGQQDNGDTRLIQCALSTPWMISTASFVRFKSVESVQNQAYSVAASNDGTRVYLSHSSLVYEWSLSTPWDVSTASFLRSSEFAGGFVRLGFFDNGKKVISGEISASTLNLFQLSTAWDLSTASQVMSSSDFGPIRGLFVDASGTRLLTLRGSSTDYSNGAILNHRNEGIVPSNLQNVDSLSWTVESSLTIATNDDTYNLSARVMSADGSVVLAAANSGGTFVSIRNVTGQTDVVSGPTAFPYVNTSANEAQWKDARLVLRQTWTQNMGADAGGAIRIDYVHLNGMYTEVPIMEWFGTANSVLPSLSQSMVGEVVYDLYGIGSRVVTITLSLNSASAEFMFAAHADGVVSVPATASTSFGFFAEATATVTKVATATAALGFEATLEGTTVTQGSGLMVATFTLVAHANGRSVTLGSAVADLGSLTAEASGARKGAGAATAPLGGLTAHAYGVKSTPVLGQASVTFGFTSIVIGTVVPVVKYPGGVSGGVNGGVEKSVPVRVAVDRVREFARLGHRVDDIMLEPQEATQVPGNWYDDADLVDLHVEHPVPTNFSNT